MDKTQTTTRHQQVVEQVCHYIHDHLEEDLSLSGLAEQVHLSPAYLQRVFKSVLGMTPRQYVDGSRVKKLKSGLKGKGNVLSSLMEAGYSSTSRVYEKASEQLGMTPGLYKKGGKGVAIGYTVGDSGLGKILLGGTDRGICMVSLGENEEELTLALREEFPKAEIGKADTRLYPWLKAVLDHLAGEPLPADLPLDLRATAFQWRVWQELRKIPLGETRTYTQIAEAIGQARAVRAVARACATNPVSIVIPCHRVIREDGSLAGYRWGLDRKKQLLEIETETETRVDS